MKKKTLYTKPGDGEIKTIITATISLTKKMHSQILKGEDIGIKLNGEAYKLLAPKNFPMLYKEGMKVKLDFEK